MDSASRAQLAFVLTLIGGIAGIALGLLFGVMGLFMGAAFNAARATQASDVPFPPAAIFYAMFGLFALITVVGGITMLVCAPRLKRPLAEGRGFAIGAIVGGSLCFVSGNVIAAGLGIAGGIVALTAPAPTHATEANSS